MKVRVLKLYQYWVVEFPFAVTVYCDTWERAIREMNALDHYLAQSVATSSAFDLPFGKSVPKM